MDTARIVVYSLALLTLLYVLACFLWAMVALVNFHRMNVAYNELSEVVRRRSAELKRPDVEKMRSWRIVMGAMFLLPIRLALFFFGIISLIFITKLLDCTSISKTTIGRKLNQAFGSFAAFLGLLVLGVKRIIQHNTEYLNRATSSGLSPSLGQPLSPPSPQSSTNPTPTNVISNHVSPVDILFFMWALNSSFVAKGSVKSSVLIGPLARSMDCVFVDRANAPDRERAARMIEQRQRQVAAGAVHRSLVIFPEGTTTNGRYILPFKTGAFEEDCPVTPCVLLYQCPDFDLSYEIIPFKWWFPLVMSSPGCITLHAHWLHPVGGNSYLYSAVDVSHQARRMMADVVYTKYRATWDYHPDDRIPEDWLGSYRGKLEVEKLVMTILANRSIAVTKRAGGGPPWGASDGVSRGGEVTEAQMVVVETTSSGEGDEAQGDEGEEKDGDESAALLLTTVKERGT
eukprot:GHVN01084556.1.p1 GENE.GHVN01084556.1~~GHVN01084556.1.p1  ORF type:complete len:457 (+),score=74.43 GHVN01084556.1:271-1641(+)